MCFFDLKGDLGVAAPSTSAGDFTSDLRVLASADGPTSHATPNFNVSLVRGSRLSPILPLVVLAGFVHAFFLSSTNNLCIQGWPRLILSSILFVCSDY